MSCSTVPPRAVIADVSAGSCRLTTRLESRTSAVLVVLDGRAGGLEGIGATVADGVAPTAESDVLPPAIDVLPPAIGRGSRVGSGCEPRTADSTTGTPAATSSPTAAITHVRRERPRAHAPTTATTSGTRRQVDTADSRLIEQQRQRIVELASISRNPAHTPLLAVSRCGRCLARTSCTSSSSATNVAAVLRDGAPGTSSPSAGFHSET